MISAVSSSSFLGSDAWRQRGRIRPAACAERSSNHIDCGYAPYPPRTNRRTGGEVYSRRAEPVHQTFEVDARPLKAVQTGYFECLQSIAGSPRSLTFDCNLESAQSNNRVGLQLIDVVLWLVRRFLKTKGKIDGDARRLAIYVIANGEITTFDRPTMIKHTKRVVDKLYSLPLSEQQMKDGIRLSREFEEKRVARMNSPIGDE